MNVTIVGANGEVGLSTIAALTASETKFVRLLCVYPRYFDTDSLAELDRICSTCFHQQARD